MLVLVLVQVRPMPMATITMLRPLRAVPAAATSAVVITSALVINYLGRPKGFLPVRGRP